jgi:predicted branched-subunit amino acid permease
VTRRRTRGQGRHRMTRAELLFWALVAVVDAMLGSLLADQRGWGTAILAAVIGVVLALFSQSRTHTRRATRRC